MRPATLTPPDQIYFAQTQLRCSRSPSSLPLNYYSKAGQYILHGLYLHNLTSTTCPIIWTRNNTMNLRATSHHNLCSSQPAFLLPSVIDRDSCRSGFFTLTLNHNYQTIHFIMDAQAIFLYFSFKHNCRKLLCWNSFFVEECVCVCVIHIQISSNK